MLIYLTWNRMLFILVIALFGIMMLLDKERYLKNLIASESNINKSIDFINHIRLPRLLHYRASDITPSRTINKVFIDKDGNEVPVFDDNTLFPKPGGGYCDMTPIADKEEFFQAIENPTVQCNDLQKYKWYMVCMDGFKRKDKCVVLSFGVNYQYDFEDMIVDRLGCHAYSFDPTMDQEDFVRKDGKCNFYNLGLSSFKGVKTIDYQQRRDRICKVDRYVNIMNTLQLANKKIDFVKIDIEGSELDFFLDTASSHPELLVNIKQMILEFHNFEECCFWHSGNRKDTNQFDTMKIIQILHCHGFALAHARWNPNPDLHFMYKGKERAVAYVTTWIRT